MRQLLVECSDPGLVVSLAEELEHVLRHVDFERARALWARSLPPWRVSWDPRSSRPGGLFAWRCPTTAVARSPSATGSLWMRRG
jgi:hypothetical protein